MDRLVAEFRAADLTGNTLVGHAAVYDQVAALPRHYETISRSAFDRVLAGDHDVRALVNHDPSMVLARTANGSLRLRSDDRGLAVEIDLPDTSYARDLRELVRSGLVTGMSIGFLPGDDKWITMSDGRQLRTHTSVAELLDVSPVTYPAYDGTNVQLRNINLRPASSWSRIIRARHAAHLL